MSNSLPTNSAAMQAFALNASRALAEKRLEAEEKKFQAGMTTNFFVLQAQRDLTTQLNNELSAIIAYNRALINFEAVQVVPPGGG